MLDRHSSRILKTVTDPKQYLQNRTVYLKVKPTPSSLEERRALLRAVQHYGRIEVFKKLADDSSFIAVPTEARTTSALRERSPLQYEFTPEPSTGLENTMLSDPSDAIQVQIRADRNASLSAASLSDMFPSPQLPPRTATFTVHVLGGYKHDHASRLRQNPLNGPWPKPRALFAQNQPHGLGFAAAALNRAGVESRPSPLTDVRGPGLCDWETFLGNELDPSRFLRWESKETSAGEALYRPLHTAFRTQIRDRIERRGREQQVHARKERHLRRLELYGNHNALVSDLEHMPQDEQNLAELDLVQLRATRRIGERLFEAGRSLLYFVLAHCRSVSGMRVEQENMDMRVDDSTTSSDDSTTSSDTSHDPDTLSELSETLRAEDERGVKEAQSDAWAALCAAGADQDKGRKKKKKKKGKGARDEDRLVEVDSGW